ncbi:MAG: hypothetical protein ACO1OB_32590 [Archangium sp.]
MPVSVVAESPVVRIGRIDSLLVSVWHGSSTLESLELLEKAQQALVDEHQQVSLLMVFTGAPKNAAPGVKERGDELARHFQPFVRTNVVLVLARGFSAIVVRTFLAAFSLVSPIAMESASTLDDAVKKLQAAKGQSPELRGHTRLVEELQAFIDVPPPRA